MYKYWKPFEAYAVERALADHPNCVIDFGAGHSVYEDDALFARVQRALAPYPNVVLVLPCADVDRALRVLRRRRPSLEDVDPDINEHFIKHPSNYALAKFTVYTDGRSPEDACGEIIRRCRPLAFELFRSN